MKIEHRPMRLSDVFAFEEMRAADAAEVMASGGYSPVEAILESWANSTECYTARFNGEVAAGYGVCYHPAGSALAPVGVAWLLTTKVVDRYPIAFYKESKRILEQFHRRYDLLFNYVDARHGRALQWAKRLGFRVGPVVEFGVNGEAFHPITHGGLNV